MAEKQGLSPLDEFVYAVFARLFFTVQLHRGLGRREQGLRSRFVSGHDFRACPERIRMGAE
jgi:hypothetical protein